MIDILIVWFVITQEKLINMSPLWYKFQPFRAYFKKIKHPRIRHFVKSALFEKKFIFLNINWICQKQLPIRVDSTSTCPSGFSKCSFVPFCWSDKSPFYRTFWFNSFILVMKNLIMNQNFYIWKPPFFHEFNFLKKHISVNKATLQISDIFY